MDLYADLKPSENLTKNLVNQAKNAGFSRIIVSLSGGDGTVAWQTPREDYYTRFRGPLANGHDALESMVRNAHDAGIEVVASVIVAEGGSITRNNPTWAARDTNGNTSTGVEFLGDTMSFAYSGARQAKVDVMMDLVNGYGIDGVFLDYTRYLYGFGYDQPVLDQLQTNYGFDARTVPVPAVGSPDQGTQEWRLFAEARAQNVQAFVQEFGNAVEQSSNPIPVGTFSDRRWGMDLDINHLGRNFPAWAQAGLVDEVWIGNYNETPLNQIRSAVSSVRTAVGQDVRLSAALTTWSNFFTTKAQFQGAVREAFLGSADGLFVYREDFVTSNSLWDESKAANDKLNHFIEPAGGTAHARYRANVDLNGPQGGVGGWANDGLAMVDQGDFLLQSSSTAGTLSRYRATSITPGLIDHAAGYYAIDFEVRPLGDLNLTGGHNMFNLHVQWADAQSIYNVVIDRDSDNAGVGTLGSLNYGSSGTSKAISGIDWSTPRQITIAYHPDDQNFYFYLDGAYISYITMNSLRIGNSNPSMENTLIFGDSSDLSGNVSAEWYHVGVFGAGIAGDFDQDGDVDGRDFLEWQRGYGTLYDDMDLANWKNNFGYQLSSTFTATVPEPAMAVLLIPALAAICGQRGGFRIGNFRIRN
jgi:uncharacterized lipoprotein YddW (UPF0748 family)